MEIKRQHLDKADPLLRETLQKASGEETVRALLVLGGEGPHEGPHDDAQSKHISPDQFGSRAEYRKALIKSQQEQIERQIAEVKRSLQQLSLNVGGGTISRTVVVEGSAGSILRSLELPGVQHASLDRKIGLIDPRRSRSDPTKA